MDSIDITDSEFSLNVPQLNSFKGVGDDVNYIYIGIAVVLLLVGVFAYNYFSAKSKHVTFKDDCEGGFCTMEKCDRQ